LASNVLVNLKQDFDPTFTSSLNSLVYRLSFVLNPIILTQNFIESQLNNVPEHRKGEV